MRNAGEPRAFGPTFSQPRVPCDGEASEGGAGGDELFVEEERTEGRERCEGELLQKYDI